MNINCLLNCESFDVLRDMLLDDLKSFLSSNLEVEKDCLKDSDYFYLIKEGDIRDTLTISKDLTEQITKKTYYNDKKDLTDEQIEIIYKVIQNNCITVLHEDYHEYRYKHADQLHFCLGDWKDISSNFSIDNFKDSIECTSNLYKLLDLDNNLLIELLEAFKNKIDWNITISNNNIDINYWLSPIYLIYDCTLGFIDTLKAYYEIETKNKYNEELYYIDVNKYDRFELWLWKANTTPIKLCESDFYYHCFSVACKGLTSYLTLDENNTAYDHGASYFDFEGKYFE